MEKVHACDGCRRRRRNLASRLPYLIWGFQHVAGFRRRHVGASIQDAWTTSLNDVRAALDADTAADRTVTPLTVDLPAGDWDATWLDPVSGPTLQTERIDRHPGGSRRLDTPRWADDVAIAVRRRDVAKRDEE